VLKIPFREVSPRVIRTIKNSPAFKAGIRPNDIISKISTNYLWNKKQWDDLSDSIHQPIPLRVQLWRDGKPIDVTVTPSDPVHIYNSACALKDANACYGLGVLYQDGEGLDKDLKRAKFYFKSACDAKSGRACSELGNLNNDPFLLEKGCSLNDAFGCRLYGVQIQKTDSSKASAAFKSACDSGDPYACFALASLGGKNTSDLPVHDLYRCACLWGHAESCRVLDPASYARMDETRKEYEQRREMERPRSSSHERLEEHPTVP
jgi:hypothetical protein